MEGVTRQEGKPFWQLVAEEIRAEAARQRLTGTEIARRIGQRQQWVSRRMVGDLPLDLDDLEAFARALDVPISQLLPMRSGGEPTGLRPRQEPIPLAA